MKKNKRVFNPVTGKYMSVAENFTCALVLGKVPELVDMWRSSGSTLLFHDWLFNIENNAPIKGVVNKLVAKNLSGVVACLIALWRESEFDTFDNYLEYCHMRAKVNAPKLNK